MQGPVEPSALPSNRGLSVVHQVGLCLADAVAYTAFGYSAVRAALLGLDGAFPRSRVVLSLAEVGIGVVALEAFWFLRGKKTGDRYRRRTAAFVLSLSFLFWIAIPSAGYLFPPRKDFSLRWLPLDWVRLPSLLEFLGRIDSLSAVAMGVLIVGLVWLGAVKRRRVLTGIAVLGLGAAYLFALTRTLHTIPKGIPVPLAMFVWTAGAAFLGAWRGFSRSLVGFGCLIGITLFFLGVYPWRDPTGAPAATTILKAGQDSPWADAFVFPRDLLFDPASRSLFLSYGPTSGWASGLLRIPLEDPASARSIPVAGGMRSIQFDPGGRRIVGVDSPREELDLFSLEPFEMVDRVDLFGRGVAGDGIAFVSLPEERRFYLLAYETAVLSEWDTESWRLLRSVNFREAGVTALRGGGLKVLHDPVRAMFYVLLGPISAENEYAVAFVDRRTLEVQRAVRLPMGSTEMIFVERNRSLYVPEGYGDRLFEIDVDAGVVRRVLPGPRAGCRSLVFDPLRNVLYGLGWGTGYLATIDLEYGRVSNRAYVGKKPGGMMMDPEAKRLWVASAAGIVEVDLERMGLPRRAAD